MTGPRAVDVPEFRAELIDYMRSDLGAGMFGIFKDMGLLPVGGTTQQIAAAETKRLAGDLYFVGADMVELARHAVKSLPEFKLAPEDLPSKSGFIVFETPIGTVKQDLVKADVPKEYSIAAASWGHFSAGRGNTGAWISWYSDQRAIAQPAAPWPTRYVFDHEFIVPFEVQHTSFVDPFHGEVLDGVPQLLDRLRVTWLLMQQPIAQVERVETYRAARRRLERAGHEPAAVRVIRLRRAAHAPGPGESEREYRHTWIVRGHWRQQWYPSREVHRPVWIAPHVKGPEGAPLLGGEKVHAWVR